MKTKFVFSLLSLGLSGNILAQSWSLDQCIDSAFLNNTAIKILANQEEIALLKTQELHLNLIPKVTANGEYKYFIELPYQLLPLSVFGGPDGQFKEAQFGVPHTINGNLTIQLPIYSSSLFGAMEKTEIAQEMVRLQLKKTKEQIYYEVTALYRNAQLLMNKKTFIESSVRNTEAMLASVKQLRKALLATGTDEKKIQLQLSVLASQLAGVVTKTEQVLNGLKLYIGLELSDPLAIDSIITLGENQLYEPNQSIESELLVVQQEIILTDINTLKKSRYLPEVGIIGYIGTNGFGYDQAPNAFLNFYPFSFAGIQVSYKIFNGTVTNKQIAQKSIEYQNLLLQEKVINDKSALEIQHAQENLKLAFNLLKVAIEQVALATDIFEEVNLLYKQGLASTFDIIQADNELRLANQNYLAITVDCIIADLELKRLTGNSLK